MKFLFDNFDKLADAPNGVQKLREMILQLAVHGKLLEQDPKDEPASVLLEKIKLEKENLFENGKIRKEKPLEPLKEGDIPFGLPNGWEWVKLGEVGTTNIGLTYSPKDVGYIGTPVLRSNNIQNGMIDLSNLVRVDMPIPEKAIVAESDLLICARNGSRALVGKSALITGLAEQMAFGAFMAIFRSRINPYVLQFILSPLFRHMIDDVNTTTINQITQSNLRNTFFPLPPLAEQKRIVSKVDQLMSLCHELEKQKKKRNKKRISLNNASLEKLLSSTKPSEFNNNWNHIVNNFGLLYSTQENVKKLKQTILQLAMQGKLVGQDPNTKPVSVLLDKIKKEKERLVREGKIKKQKELPEITEDEKPFELPKGWEWCRLGTITKLITDGKHGDCIDELNSGYYFLSAKDIQNGKLLYNNARQIIYKDFLEVHNRTDLQPGDVCIVNTGATVGKMAIAPNDPLTQKTTFQKSVAIVKLFSKQTIIEFMEYLLINTSTHFKKQSGGSAINNLLLGDMRKVVVAIPPITEQKHIVAKVDQLMALCDTLEKSLSFHREKSERLVNAVVSGV